jgi:repressor LexA
MIMKNNLRSIRIAREISVAELAQAVGKSPQFIYQLEKGEKNIPQKLLPKFCEILQTTPNELLGIPGSDYTIKKTDDLYLPPNALPILGVVRAGQPILAEQNLLGYRIPPKEIRGDFWLEVDGDSMEPSYPKGSLVFIRYQQTADHGDIVVALMKNENTASLKRVLFIDKKVILRSFNPAYDDIILDAREVEIIGKAVYPLPMKRKDWV